MATKTQVDKILSANFVLPIHPPNTVLANHSIVVKDKNIVAILPTSEALSLYSPQEQHEEPVHGSILLPGLINAHTHIAMSMLRSYADGVPLGEWLNDYIWPAEHAHVGPEFCKLGALLSLSEMVRSGVTCFSDMYFFPEQTAEAVKEVGCRGVIGLPIIMFPNAWAATPDEHLEKGASFQDKYEDKEHIFCTYSPHAPYTVDNGSFEKIGVLAKEKNMRVHTHLHETKKEVEDSLNDHKDRPFARLDKLGVVNERLIAVHMTQLTQEEIEKLAEVGGKVVTCPESNLKLASGMCDVKQLLDAGVMVGIGTDGAGSNDDQCVFGEVRTAALLSSYMVQMRGERPMHAHTFLEMATINNAKILGIDHLVGSLEVGKRADIIKVQLRNPPFHDPVSSLVYVGTNEVQDVWVGGEGLVVGGKVVCVDEEKLREEAEVWGAKIQATKKKE